MQLDHIAAHLKVSKRTLVLRMREFHLVFMRLSAVSASPFFVQFYLFHQPLPWGNDINMDVSEHCSRSKT